MKTMRATKLCSLALFFCLKISNSIHEQRTAVVGTRESTTSSGLSPPSTSAFVTPFFRDKRAKSNRKWPTSDTSALQDNVYDPTWLKVTKTHGRQVTHRKRSGADSAEDGDGRSKSRFVSHPKRINNRMGSRNERLGWNPFKLPSPPLFDHENHAFPIFSWSRRPNDMLVVVLQQQQPATAASPQCACNQRADTTSLRNFSSPADQPNDSTTAAEPQLREQPSACVWAIVACCSPVNFHFRYGCFHYLACTVVFWQVEPCQLSIILAASREATRYYEQFLPTPSSTPSTVGNESTTATSSGTTTTSVTPSIPTTTEATTATAATTEPTTQVVEATITDDASSTTVIESPSQSSSTR